MKRQKQNITVTLYNDRAYSLPSKVTDLKAWLDEKLAEVPAEFRDSADMEICTEDSYGDIYAQVTLTYSRPESDAEEAERLATQAQLAARRQALDLKQLAELKAKYETPKP